LNPYGHFWPLDFKSSASTSSATRVKEQEKKIQTHGLDFNGAEDRARTGHPNLGKVVLYQMSYFRKQLKELFFQDRKDKYPLLTTKFMMLFVLRSIQSVLGNLNLRLALVPVVIQTVAAANCKRYDTEYLQIKQEY
jgi:hypothetical protein